MKTGKYQHFKGNFYQVLHIAKHSETEEEMVVYHPENDISNIWVRPLIMFNEVLIKDGKTIKRFHYVD